MSLVSQITPLQLRRRMAALNDMMFNMKGKSRRIYNSQGLFYGNFSHSLGERKRNAQQNRWFN